MKKKQKVVRIHPRKKPNLAMPVVLTVDETLLCGQPSMCMVMIR